MLRVYGIKNCDTVKKALKWLDGEGIAYSFHDLRTDGVNEEDVKRWAEALGWESLLNKRSTTWRELPEKDKNDLDFDRAVMLMVKHPTLIKRPVFVGSSMILNGFSDHVRASLV